MVPLFCFSLSSPLLGGRSSPLSPLVSIYPADCNCCLRPQPYCPRLVLDSRSCLFLLLCPRHSLVSTCFKAFPPRPTRHNISQVSNNANEKSPYSFTLSIGATKMATLSAPSPQSVPASFSANRGHTHRPLSTHGLPKAPRTMSPERPHRFSALGPTSPSLTSATLSPRSPGPMSPPMSAKSFGTFIDSEPSTPAYSPRMDYEWDSSTLVLLRPMSSSSEPATPTEPVWDMMAPIKLSQRLPPVSSRKKPGTTAHEVSRVATLSPPPVKKTRSAKPAKENRVVDLCQKENQAPQDEGLDNDEKKQLEEDLNTNASSAPLGKLASKMKLMLRRKNTSDKKKPKKEKDYYDVDRMDDVHWTEM